MATGAGLAEWEQTHGKKKAKCVLTSTGLLMEGVMISQDELRTKASLWLLGLSTDVPPIFDGGTHLVLRSR
jgi:hypothetical protein